MQYAVEHYPTVRAALEQVEASTAGVERRAQPATCRGSIRCGSRTARTANNIFGQVLPQSVIPAMSGPVLPSASADSVWGSAVGALFSWEPFDFGLRGATVAGAEAAVTRARAGEALTRLEVQSAVGAAFLGVVAAERAVVAAQADLDRRDTLARIVHTLVDNQLRPGADGIADRRRARRRRARGSSRRRQALTIAQTTLTRVLGVKAGPVVVDASRAARPDAGVRGRRPPAATAHPLAQVHQAAVDVGEGAGGGARATPICPRVYLQSSVFARGSGANPNGQLDGGAGGLGLDRANWAAGVQVVFPNLFDFSSLRARKAGAAASERAEAALYDEAMLTISSQQQAAAALVQAARAVAANTPVQLGAAQQSESQARARYQAGLAGLVEVADAQSLLAQAEYQDQIARVEVWRALLAEGGGARRSRTVPRRSFTPTRECAEPCG